MSKITNETFQPTTTTTETGKSQFLSADVVCNFFARSRLPTECRAILAVDSSKSILPYIPFDSIGIDSEPYVSQHKIVVYVLWHSLVWHPCTFHVCWHREREKEIEWENRRNQEKKKIGLLAVSVGDAIISVNRKVDRHESRQRRLMRRSIQQSREINMWLHCFAVFDWNDLE